MCAASLAIELLCAAQGLDLRSGEHSHHGDGTEQDEETSVVDLPGSRKGKITNFIPGHKLADTLKAGRGVHAAYHLVREHITHMDEDREIHLDIAAAEELLASGKLLAAVVAEIGELE